MERVSMKWPFADGVEEIRRHKRMSLRLAEVMGEEVW